MISSFAVCSQAATLCTATNDNYPGFDQGLLFSKEVSLTGAQGTQGGHLLLYKTKHAEFWLVSGITIKVGDSASRLLGFYTEIKLKNSKGEISRIMRSKSGINDGIMQARTELVQYPEESFLYKNILIFDCKLYE